MVFLAFVGAVAVVVALGAAITYLLVFVGWLWDVGNRMENFRYDIECAKREMRTERRQDMFALSQRILDLERHGSVPRPPKSEGKQPTK